MNKRNKPIIIVGIVTLVIALAVFIAGGLIAGWDFTGYFKSQNFIWLCVILSLYVLFVVIYIIQDKIRKL